MSAPLRVVEEQRSPAQRMHELFGADEAYTLLSYKRAASPGEKAKKTYDPLPPTPPSLDRWESHLSGARGVVPVPIARDGLCRWGCIDVDRYDISLGDIVAAVKTNDLPLVVCGSCSGGAHLYLFLTEPVPAEVVQARLREMAAMLGYPSDTEIFPKQTSVPEGKHGSGVNAPYFGGDATDRYGVKPNGLAMSVPEFLAEADARRVSPHELTQIALRARKTKTKSMAGDDDARRAGTREGAGWARRNLERFAEEISAAKDGRRRLLYGRAKDMGRMIGAGWIGEDEVFDKLLEAGMACGKTMSEASTNIVRGIEDGKKEPPEDEPDADRYPTIERIVVLVGGEEEAWRLTLAECGDITLPVREVMHYYTFNTRCAARLRVSFRQLKNDAWSDRINEALRHASEEQVPRDETPEWVFFEQLRSFVMDRHRADSIDEILVHKPWHDEEADRIYFTVSDLQSHLARGATILKAANLRRIGRLLNELGTEGYDIGKTTKKLKGETKELRWVRRSLFQESGPIALPFLPGDPL